MYFLAFTTATIMKKAILSQNKSINIARSQIKLHWVLSAITSKVTIYEYCLWNTFGEVKDPTNIQPTLSCLSPFTTALIMNKHSEVSRKKK